MQKNYRICKNQILGYGNFSKVYIGYMTNQAQSAIAIKEIGIQNNMQDVLKEISILQSLDS